MPPRTSWSSWLKMVVCAGVLALCPPSHVRAQAPERSRSIAPYLTGMLGWATGPGECVDGPCFPSAPMVFVLGGGARVRLASLGERGAGVWASLGPEYVRIPLFLSDLPTPTAWLAAGRITVGARWRVAVAGSTGKFHDDNTRGRIVQWRVHAQYEHGLVFAGVTQLRAMRLSQLQDPQPFRPRLLVYGSGFDF